jgi:hypothetical protein
MELYEVCALIKIRNRTNDCVSKRKFNLLDLALINICKPLFFIFNSARYFLKIINNYIYKSWVISLWARTEAKAILETWRRNKELALESKFKVIRSDNGSEFKSTLDK